MTARSAAYTRTRAAGARLGTGIAAVHAGLWLGVLDGADLHAVDEAHYTGAEWYQRAGSHHGLFAWEQAAIDAHFPPAGDLLVTAAGTGREALALDGRGHTVTAYECHPALAAQGRELLAREARHGSRLLLIGRDEPPPAGGPYAGAVVGWSSYSLIAGRAARVRFLAGVRAVLEDGAPLLLSHVGRRPGDRALRLEAAVAATVRRLRRAAPVELGDHLGTNFVHRFTGAEVADELARAGFAVTSSSASRRGPAVAASVVATALPLASRPPQGAGAPPPSATSLSVQPEPTG